MFERFTERARQVVKLAREEARVHHDHEVTLRHILLGLFRDESSLAGRVLRDLGVDEERVRAEQGEVRKEPSPPDIPFQDSVHKVLERALREALSLGHNYIGTEHILLALASFGASLTGRAPQVVRKAVLEALGAPTTAYGVKVGPNPVSSPPAPPDDVIQKLLRLGLFAIRDALDIVLKEFE